MSLGDTVQVPLRFQEIRTYRNPERKECDPSEDPRRRAQGTYTTIIIPWKRMLLPVLYSVTLEEISA